MKPFFLKRGPSYAIIAAVYLTAALLGVGIYWVCPFPFAVSLLIADLSATVYVFLFSLIFRNASVYDPYWSVQPPVIATAFAVAHGANPLGVMLLVAIWFWAIRLTANWAYVFYGLEHQDWRYTMLKEKTGIFYPVVNLVGIHLVPSLVVYGCVLPVVFALAYGWEYNLFCNMFCILAIFSAAMQGVADVQMHRFRKKKTGDFIRLGLWKYSRHPNYLGEILTWWFVGLAVVAAAPSYWFLLAGALCNTLLFLCVSIPMADKRQSRKEGWTLYEKQTRMLLPLYKKQ